MSSGYENIDWPLVVVSCAVWDEQVRPLMVISDEIGLKPYPLYINEVSGETWPPMTRGMGLVSHKTHSCGKIIKAFFWMSEFGGYVE